MNRTPRLKNGEKYLDQTITDAIGGGVVGLLGLELERREVRAEFRVVIDVRSNLRWFFG